jgi:hypothetical protein
MVCCESFGPCGQIKTLEKGMGTRTVTVVPIPTFFAFHGYCTAIVWGRGGEPA